ncbi:hypothetical protein S13b_00059 [Klebsiella phage VLCpiS13b]|uniref:hypothetical protein n=1 Tax=Klebsiella phage VLCpiS13b TaxID=2874886 RepID=UPI00233F6CF9|nr:hypothetical protein PRB92_gp66 [Klebsiella phage VLCpiS13b]UVX30634.1 hypothetical protein S13b_00059 [Klebsiella phage VLCpiS13b]
MKVKCTKSENESWIVGELYTSINEGSGYISIGHDEDHNAGYNLILTGYDDNKKAQFVIPIIGAEFIEA